MATLNTTLRNRLCNRAVSNLDRMEFLDEGGVTLIVFNLVWEDASVGNVGQAVLSNTPLRAQGQSTGDAVEARLYQSDGQEAIEGLTLGAANADIAMASVYVKQDREVQLDIGSINVPGIFNP